MPDEADDDEPIRAPGLAALLRRHPRRVRQAAAGAIAAGVALFVIASLVLPAGADAGHKKAAVGTTRHVPDLPQLFPTDPPPVQRVLATRPQHVSKPAPATKAVISGLAANGIPNVALNAYRVAAARMAAVQPACGIDWALLAGIGREESDHGQFAGATLHADGTSTPPVVGIPLNGHGTALIRDTDRGRLDGDAVYDRAVGPMQFIPSTWAAYGSDANGDGRADVFNINDAALTAARYLCAAGGNLRTHAGQVAAILAYNHSDQYLAQVLALAAAYRTGIPVHGLPVGNVTGGLPPVHNTGAAPPVNPGPPTAVGPTAAQRQAAAKQAAAKKAAAAKKKKAGSSPAKSSQPPAGGAPSSAAATTPTPKPILPLPTHSTTKPKPTPTPTKTCILNLLGICV
jgi:transglycosylase-like protein with SLT domain